MKEFESSIKRHDKLLAERIEHFILEFATDPPLGGRCFHLNYSDVQYDQDEFAEILLNTLPLFALSEREYASLRVESLSEMDRVARSRITTNASASDFGELALFLLLDYFFKVPKFVTKVRMRSSTGVAVFGSDAAHVSFNNESEPVLWLGESKFMAKFSNAADKAYDSLKDFLTVDALKSELRLLDPNVEANSNFDDEFIAKIKKITRGAIPIGQFDIRIPILILSDSPAAKSSQSVAELQEKLLQECDRRFKTLSGKSWPILARVKLDFIILPLSDKSALVKKLKARIS